MLNGRTESVSSAELKAAFVPNTVPDEVLEFKSRHSNSEEFAVGRITNGSRFAGTHKPVLWNVIAQKCTNEQC